MKKIVFLCAAVIALTLAACGAKEPAAENITATPTIAPSPAVEREPTAAPVKEIEAEPEAEEREPSITPTPEPTKEPTPISYAFLVPEDSPPVLKETVEIMLSLLKENNFPEIQPLLTDWYDFDAEGMLNRENFLTMIALSEYEIVGEILSGYTSYVEVKVTRPDINEIHNEFFEKQMDYESEDFFEGSPDDYLAFAFETGNYKLESNVYKLTLHILDIEGEGRWYIEFNEELHRLVHSSYINPFASAGFNFTGRNDNNSRDESLAYIAEYITVYEDGGNLFFRNDGNKTVKGMTLKLELYGPDGEMKRTAYYEAFSGYPDYLYGTYEMRPGYIYAAERSFLFDHCEPSRYGADINNFAVSVFDVQYRNALPLPSLNSEKRAFADSYISIEDYKIESSRTSVFWLGYGITGLRIKNKSAETITHLALLVEFMDEDGVARADKAFNVITEETEDSYGGQIDPGAEWALGRNYMFPFYNVPRYLVDVGNLRLSIVELEYN